MQADVSPNGDVVVYKSSNMYDTIETVPTNAPEQAAAKGSKELAFSIGEKFNSASVYGVKIEATVYDSLVIATPGKVKVVATPAS